MLKSEKPCTLTPHTESSQSNEYDKLDQWKRERREKQRILILSQMSTQDRVRNLLK